MRTVLYIYQPSTVTIRAQQTNDETALLNRYNRGAGQVAVGTHKLDAGIYMIESRDPMEVTGSNMDVVFLHGKDIPPDPKIAASALEPGATVESIRNFLEDAKDVSPSA